MGVTGVLHRCYRIVEGELTGCDKVLQWYYRRVTGVLESCYRAAIGMLNGC